MRNPWVGLRPFEPAERDLFFGRDREIRILANLIATLPAVVVFAPSGTGKSSLLNAGVIPEFAGDDSHVIVPIRDPREDVFATTRRALGDAGWTPSKDPSGLAALLEEHWDQTDRRAVIVVDQFEERANASVPTDDVFDTVARLTHGNSDAACIVISIREDYLAALEPVMRRVPGLLNGSYRVPPLSRSDLETAIHGPLERLTPGASVEEQLVATSLDDLDEQSTRRQEPGEQRFEPGYFQIVWSRLWDELPGDGAKALTLEHYRALGGAGTILKDFTAQTLSALEPASAEMFWAMTRYLVLPTGAKTALTVDDLTRLIQDADFLMLERARGWIARRSHEDRALLIRRVLQVLTSSSAPLFQRVIRSDREEFELLHDVLGAILLEWRQEFQTAWTEHTLGALDAAERRARDLRYSRPRSRLGRTPPTDEWRAATVPEATAELRAYIAELSDEDERGEPGEHTERVNRIAMQKALITEYSRFSSHVPDIRVKEEMIDPVSAQLAQWSAAWDDVVEIGIKSDSEVMRRGLQELIPVWPLRTDIELSPRDVRPAVTIVTSVLLSASAAVIAYLFTRAIAGGLNISYAGLTLAHAAIVLAFVYGAVFAEAEGRWTSRVARCLLPPLPSYSSAWRVVRIAALWPLPLIYLAAMGVAVAAGFDALGWSATAGFNEGVVVGGLVTLLMAIVIFD